MGAILLAAVVAAFLAWNVTRARIESDTARPPRAGAVPIAVLGDSDSHSYQDRLNFPPGSPLRGGPLRSASLQWTEVLARLRGESLDLGPWGTWGTRGLVAVPAGWFGQQLRTPRKEDYLHNFAVSGARCEELLHGPRRQVDRLLDLMGRSPQHWAHGMVVIRIGVNNFGGKDALDRLAADPQDTVIQQEISSCLGWISESVAAIRSRHPEVRFVVVGVFNNAHWYPYLNFWQDSTAQTNIALGLNRFDDGLKQQVSGRPGMAFFDDRAWFAARWGARDSAGRPAYTSVKVGAASNVTNTSGDDPRHAVLADGHAGTVWNALWAQAFVNLINEAFALGISPIENRDIATLLQGNQRVEP